MATRTTTINPLRQMGKPGRPRRVLDAARVRRLREEGRTLNEIAEMLGCGRGTVARALARVPSAPERASQPGMALGDRAAELARSRKGAASLDAEAPLRLREHARHLAHRRWGDRMQVNGRNFEPAEPKRGGPRWAGVLLMAGGLLLWAMGCPVPL